MSICQHIQKAVRDPKDLTPNEKGDKTKDALIRILVQTKNQLETSNSNINTLLFKNPFGMKRKDVSSFLRQQKVSGQDGIHNEFEELKFIRDQIANLLRALDPDSVPPDPSDEEEASKDAPK